MSEKQYPTQLLMTEFVTHDVKRFILEKPHGYIFEPGQATELTIDHPLWIDRPRPFTFTSVNDDHVLELIIKRYSPSQYPDHTGVTEKLHQLKPGSDLLITPAWGSISYNGPGVFIAGGAGITPFIAILRMLSQRRMLDEQRLFFSNKASRDVLLEKELKHMFGFDQTKPSQRKNLVLSLTREKKTGYEFGRINQEFLDKYISNFNQKFYLCGPPAMVSELKTSLTKIGAQVDSLVFES